ncbi:MAG: tetratricopeptide repeat protein [Candidatus Omnitrophica bacterium]|nr:tetratricopeptide repeat protein [Candidatus Omnitrophota bacterium]
MKAILQKFLLLFTVVFVAGCSVNQSVSSSRKLTREGDRYFSEGKIDKAIELWQQALDYQQKPELYEKIVMAYITENRLSDAEVYISKGLTYFPNNVNLFFNLALINFYNNDFDRAKKHLDRVLEINKYYRDAHFLKGLMYEKKGDITAAKREFVNELNVNPGSRRAWKKLRELKDE